MNIYDKMRERVAFELFLLIRAEGDFDSLSLESAYATWQFEGKPFRDTAKKILSIRLNDKGEPDPEGRYGIAVVDRKAEVPKNPYSGINIDSAQVKAGYLYVTKDLRQGFDECKEAMLKAGFVKELKEVSNG